LLADKLGIVDFLIMFTGIIAETGLTLQVDETSKGIRLEIQAEHTSSELRLGDSIAVNGCCLTAVGISEPDAKKKRRISLDLLKETWDVTNLHTAGPGSLLNLERPLSFNGSLDGHFVTGHVDGVGKVLKWEQHGGDWLLEIQPPEKLMHLLVHKGSVALDGISLTVAKVLAQSFQVWIIPHTYQVTNLHARKPGSLINIETDLLGKYVERFIQARKI
jgi:riboflavin synthase